MIKRLAPLYAAASVLALTTVLTVSATAPLLAQAAASKISKSQAGFVRIKVGDVEVTALSDGTIPVDTGLLITDHRRDLEKNLARSFVKSPVDTTVNAYLIKTSDKLILVDTGTAELFGPSLGKLPASLHNAGFEPEQITDILLTHIHTDHTGGLMEGGRRVYPKATVHVERKEVDFWLNPANKEKASQGQKVFFDQAVLKFKPYVDSGQVKPFDGAVELFPGIHSIPAPGHTPGHTLYSLESKGEKLVFWGDVFHMGEVQFPDPSVAIQFDVDPHAAEQMRSRLIADAAEKHYLVAPAHVWFPGVGHISRDGQGYRWYPVSYVNDAPTAK